MRRWVLSLLAAFAGAFAASTSAAPSPSFDCTAAKDTIAKTICSDPALAEADATMARLYKANRTSAFGRGPSNELAAQREWLKDREGCKTDAPIAACLTRRYASRNQMLAVASLFIDPEFALATLRKLDPEAAPMYEAITIYVDAPKSWNAPLNRDRMIHLLQSYFERFKSENMLGFGKDILADSGIKETADALKSDQSFIQFIQIASAYLQSNPTPHQMPCAAIVRRRDLLDATDAVFGSTLDNFILYPDCEETLPPLPALKKLVDKIDDSWPNCEGTIRYSAYRFFDTAVNQARLGIGPDAKEFVRSGDAHKPVKLTRVKGVPPALANAAIAELTKYYQAYRDVDAKIARAYAVSQIQGILAGAHGCGE